MGFRELVVQGLIFIFVAALLVIGATTVEYEKSIALEDALTNSAVQASEDTNVAEPLSGSQAESVVSPPSPLVESHATDNVSGNTADNVSGNATDNVPGNATDNISDNVPETDESLSNNHTVNQTMDLSQNKSNNTKAAGRTKNWECKSVFKNFTSYGNKTVILVEEANLTEMLNTLNQTNSCALVYFYLRWCMFSCQMSGKINRIGLFYPNTLPVMAVDVQKSPGLAAKYGIVGVPTVLLFYGKKPVAKFNGTSSLEDLELFIKDTTGFDIKQNISEAQLNNTTGPLPTIPEKKRDLYLMFSVGFLVFLLFSKIVNTDLIISIKHQLFKITTFLPWLRNHEKLE